MCELAMIAPALVDGKPLSHPDLDRAWRSFIEHGVTPVFHVADQPRVFDDAWYTDDGAEGGLVNVVESVFLYTPAALSLTDLIVNGVLERLPDLRIGIVELSAIWVPQFLMMLDGGYEFTSKLNGRVPAPAVDATERVLPAPGAGRGLLVRAARGASSARAATSSWRAPTTRTPKARRRRSRTTSARAPTRPRILASSATTPRSCFDSDETQASLDPISQGEGRNHERLWPRRSRPCRPALRRTSSTMHSRRGTL